MHVRAWAWLNGKKTTLGAAVLLASALATQVVVGVWEYEPWWMAKAVATLDWIGMVVAGGGLTHKATKMWNGNGEGQS